MKWTWQVDGTEVVADMNAWSGKRTVRFGADEVPQDKGGLRATFRGEIEGASAELIIGLKLGFVPVASLVVAGAEVPPTTGPHSMPLWAWPFVIACIAIVVISKGGAVPGGLAGGGAAACFYAAIGGPSSRLARLGICAVITAACWGTYFGLVAALT